jgi:hypothetical protein
MTTATATDLDAIWFHLDGLTDMDIPSDLTEIDAAWIYAVLNDVDSECIQEALMHVTRKELDLYAYDLRDRWHTARCEALDWDRNGRFDYE